MKSREDLVELAATYMATAEAIRKKDQPKLQAFDGIEPLVWPEIYGNEKLFMSDLDPIRSGIRPNFSFLTHETKEGSEEETGNFCLARVKLASPKELRGKAAYAPLILKTDHGWLNRRGAVKFDGQTDFFGWNGKFWKPLHLTSVVLKPEALQCYFGFQWVRDRSWYVSLGFDDAPRVSFQTTPTGAREVFRLRDIPNGKGRRAALRHWVSEHWRTNAMGADDIFVRKHLRGSCDFTWNGMRCSIRVPDPEKEQERIDLVNDKEPTIPRISSENYDQIGRKFQYVRRQIEMPYLQMMADSRWTSG